MKAKAHEILELLRQRHVDDVFVPECKNGPTTTGPGHLRMDVWAMLPRWSNPKSICYEIKVSRSDFLGDDKWQGYLPYCNEFYFVCPAGLINASELGEHCGLMYVTTNGTGLVTKKKSPYRDVVIPESLYRYILMWRAGSSSRSREDWEKWRAEKDGKRDLGRANSKLVRQELNGRIREADKKLEQAKALVGEYEQIRRAIKDIGMDPDKLGYYQTKIAVEKIRNIASDVPPELEGLLRRLNLAVGSAIEEIGRIKCSALPASS